MLVPIVNSGQQQKLPITESVSNRRCKQQKSTHRREEPPTSHASSDNSSATYVATLEGHHHWVYSVAFHPTAPLLATGSGDSTVRLWLLSCDNSSATCVATLAGHSRAVLSVAFHPTAPLLATAYPAWTTPRRCGANEVHDAMHWTGVG